MTLSADIKAEFNVINLMHVNAIGTFDDPNGNYFMIIFNLSSGKITWKYDNLKQRDEKLAEAVKLMNS